MAQTDHEAFVQPSKTDAVVWRYIDIAKFAFLLVRRCLVYTQLAQLQDTYEGTLPTLDRDAMLKQWQEIGRDQGWAPSPGYPADQIVAYTRRTIYVNCWSMHEHESEALWRIYGDPQGIALRTTYAKLAQVAPDSVHDFIGLVRYADYARATVHRGNSLDIAMAKRIQYHFEQEVRLLRWVLPPEGPKDDKGGAAVLMDQNPPFVLVDLDLERVVEEVVVSPYAAPWVMECIVGLVEKLAPTLRVRWSSMK